MQSLARRLEQGGVLSAHGVSQAAQPFFGALLRHLFPARPIVVVTDHLKLQEIFEQDFATWLSEAESEKGRERTAHAPAAPGAQPPPHDARLLFYPAWDILPQEAKLPHADTISDRLQTLVALAGHSPRPGAAPLVVTSVAALLQRTFTPGNLRQRMRSLRRGDRVDPLDLTEWLEALGYEPEAQVTQKGELAVRGGIVDVYPPTNPWPVRLEFFGDELESLRAFDPITQTSREEIPSVLLPPAGELGLLKHALAAPASPPFRLGTLLDYLSSDAILLLCDPERLEAAADEYSQQVQSGDPFFAGWDEIRRAATAKSVPILELSEAVALGGEHATTTDETDSVVLNFPGLDAYRPLPERAPDLPVAEAQRREFFAQLHRWLRQDYAVHVFCNNDGERQRFEEVWQELGLDRESNVEGREPATPAPRSTFVPQPSTHLGSLARGFLSDDARLVVITDAEIFGRYKIQRPRRLRSAHAQAMRSALDIDFTELEEGDYVVHVQHGIGRYFGLQSLPTRIGSPDRQSATGNRQSEECLVIEYAATDPAQAPPKLYVPVSEAHLVSKYVGAGKARPPLNTLGGSRWRKIKEEAERAVRDVASELLSIQAARETQPGHPFPPDTAWQREFESAFLYEETPDQFKAIQETKADMEQPKPMDRLICGDVGFGKTEVAIRAAFKAVLDGRQVAVLVPTTVLAQQHFNTFRERMADYPVRIELLSRFRTRRQQEHIVKDLAAGAVDIVIGTHRLIQDDVAFKDLGLVVIDEEQRFGVMHKEKFKLLRRMVDVLTLSATPIPRTLYLALAGARDMSTIQTPPHDRLPVETIVAEYDERAIRDAIRRELNRGGQVFFLHNRVMTIHLMEQKLRTLVPDARVVVGHGQMEARELEEVMTKFVNGEADVLLSTTIIESGLDIPNANTIIIDRADRFGLSDLYQLRGRVGRYKHQAYAYLLLPRHARLLSDVRKRISAIRQYSTLGSGFKIAMRDLEIRGAGNLLGAEQSGHITAVGFELYCQLLKQSVGALKGEKVKPRVNVEVRLDFITAEVSSPSSAVSGRSPKEEGTSGGKAADPAPLATDKSAAFLPLNYVPEPRHRIELYRKLAQATDRPALESLRGELRDRFGVLPAATELLLQIAELKILAAERGITVIEVKEDRLMLTRNNDYVMVGGKFPRLTKKMAEAKLKEIKKLLLAL